MLKDTHQEINITAYLLENVKKTASLDRIEHIQIPVEVNRSWWDQISFDEKKK